MRTGFSPGTGAPGSDDGRRPWQMVLALLALTLYLGGAPYLEGWSVRRAIVSRVSGHRPSPVTLALQGVCDPAEWVAMRWAPYYHYFSSTVSRTAGTKPRPWSSAKAVP